MTGCFTSQESTRILAPLLLLVSTCFSHLRPTGLLPPMVFPPRTSVSPQLRCAAIGASICLGAHAKRVRLEDRKPTPPTPIATVRLALLDGMERTPVIRARDAARAVIEPLQLPRTIMIVLSVEPADTTPPIAGHALNALTA